MGGLLSTLPGQQPSVHAMLALRCHHIPTTHAFMHELLHALCNIFLPGHQGSTYFRYCMTMGFGPFNLPTRGQLWNRRGVLWRIDNTAFKYGHECIRNSTCTHLPLDSSVLSTRSMPSGGNLPVPRQEKMDTDMISIDAGEMRIRLMSWLEKSGLD